MSDAAQPDATLPTPPANFAEDARGIIDDLVFEDPDQDAFNPVTAGLELWDDHDDGDDDEWIEQACDKINEYGARAFLRRMLEELRTTLDMEGYDGEEEDDEQTVRDNLAGHLLDKRVMKWQGPDADWPLSFDALLMFEDGHVLPIDMPPNIQKGPSAKSLNALPGKYLVAVFIQQDANALPYLVLSFHKTSLTGDELEWEEVQGRGFTRVPTTLSAAQKMLCPEEVEQVTDQVGHMMVDGIMAHLNHQRVAHQELEAGVPTLVFDDSHRLPLLPADRLASTDTSALEDVVGRFLVMAAIDQQHKAPYLILYFHDQADRVDSLLGQTQWSREASAKLEAQLCKEPATRLLRVAPESALHIVCPGRDGVHPETL